MLRYFHYMVNLTGELRRDGCAIRYADSGGTGDAVVMTHGAGADHHMFDRQFEVLVESGVRVVVWDLRGHGLSTSNSVPFTADTALGDLSALLAECRLSRPVLVGHSLGGNLSQALVRREPERFRGLAVLDATWNTGPLTWAEKHLLKLAAPMLSLIPRNALPRLMARASAVTTDARTDAIRAFSQMSKEDFIAVWRATTTLVVPDPAYRTPVPLCLVRGALDRTGNIATAMPRWAAAEGVTEKVVAGAGHLVTQDAPDEVAAILRSFVADLLAS